MRKQGVLINNKYNPSYNRVGNFVPVLDGRKEILHGNVSVYMTSEKKPLQSVVINSTECYDG